ncbi:hypothetical protein EFT87_07805 [Schleiferilactobacillus harbinensis]|nr:hypothetical protein [Schleiferilactobacillus harbinensis]
MELELYLEISKDRLAKTGKMAKAFSSRARCPAQMACPKRATRRAIPIWFKAIYISGRIILGLMVVSCRALSVRPVPKVIQASLPIKCGSTPATRVRKPITWQRSKVPKATRVPLVQ